MLFHDVVLQNISILSTEGSLHDDIFFVGTNLHVGFHQRGSRFYQVVTDGPATQ